MAIFWAIVGIVIIILLAIFVGPHLFDSDDHPEVLGRLVLMVQAR
jgi:hypothetical protein